MLLCAIVLGASWPILAALPELPTQVLTGGVYVLTQGTAGTNQITEALAAALVSQSWAEVVSPEILAFGTLRGEPVLARGVEPVAFAQVEGGRWLPGEPASDRWAIAGTRLAGRLGLVTGDRVTLVGSAIPRIEIARIEGTFVTDTSVTDELLVDLGLGRSLTGLDRGVYHVIRVRTVDPQALLAFLETSGASVHVSGPGLPRADINSGPPPDPRVVNLLFRSGFAGLPPDYLSLALPQATNSVSVVALGLMGFVALLVAAGIHSVQTRAFEDHRANVGVLRTLGAGNGWIRMRMLRESLPTALGAAIVGAGIGLVFAALIARGQLVLFGHAVPVAIDLTSFVLVVAAILVSSLVSALVLIGAALRERSMELLTERAEYEPPQSLEAILRG